MSEELKPCPFCGEKPSSGARFKIGYVKCGNKACIFKPSIRRKDKNKTSGFSIAAEAWNTRTDNKELERLRGELATLQKRQLPEGFKIGKLRSGEQVIVVDCKNTPEKEKTVLAIKKWGGYNYHYKTGYAYHTMTSDNDLIEIDGEKTEAGKDQ